MGEKKLKGVASGVEAGSEPVPNCLPWGVCAKTPKFAETPFTVKLFASVLCPATLNWPGAKVLLGATTIPGVSWRRVLKLRPLSGRFSTNFRSITVLTAADCEFTSGAPPSTVTVSEAAPTGSVKLIASASWTFKTTSGLIKVLNPIFDTWRRYGPGGRL